MLIVLSPLYLAYGCSLSVVQATWDLYVGCGDSASSRLLT